MEILALITGCFGSSLIILSGLAFLRAKDVFTMTHVVMICGLYAIPITMIAIELEKFSVASLVKIALLILLNWIGVNLICHIAAKQAIANGINPDVVAEVTKN